MLWDRDDFKTFKSIIVIQMQNSRSNLESWRIWISSTIDQMLIRLSPISAPVQKLNIGEMCNTPNSTEIINTDQQLFLDRSNHYLKRRPTSKPAGIVPCSFESETKHIPDRPLRLSSVCFKSITSKLASAPYDSRRTIEFRSLVSLQTILSLNSWRNSLNSTVDICSLSNLLEFFSD